MRARDGRNGERDAFKKMIWNGKVLFGMIMFDEHRAVDDLVSRPEVDPKRIRAFGLSMAASVPGGTNLLIGVPLTLFEFRYNVIAESPDYSVNRDGSRFLLNKTVEAETNSPLTVMVNWPAGLKK